MNNLTSWKFSFGDFIHFKCWNKSELRWKMTEALDGKCLQFCLKSVSKPEEKYQCYLLYFV